MLNQTLCTSFKAQVLLGVHDFRASGGDTFKLALYTSLADLGASTTQYTSAGEVSGTNYVAGGVTLVNLGVLSDDTLKVGFTSFAPTEFTLVTLTARGGLIYNTTPSALSATGAVLTNPAVCVLDFGADKTFTARTMDIDFPLNTGSDAIIRIA